MTVKFFKNAENKHHDFVTVEKFFHSGHRLCKFLFHYYRVAILMNDFKAVTVL